MTQALLVESGLDTPSAFRLQKLLDGLIDAAVIVDRDLHPIAWNAAYVQSVGLRPRRFGKIAGAPGARCCDQFRLQVCENDCLALRCFNTKRATRMDEINGKSVHLEGEDPRTLIVSATPIEDEAGGVVAVLEIYRDVTAEARIQSRYRALLEAERQRAETLEEQVRERTADLEKSLGELKATREQLVQSEKLSALGQLIAGIAHEINNPINFIYGNLEFLESHIGAFRQLISGLDKSLTESSARTVLMRLMEEVDYAYVAEDVDNLLRSVRTGAERAIAIIRDLRFYVHRGQQNFAPVDLPQSINTALNLLAHELRGRITIEKNFGESPPPAWGNEGQLTQVFINLLINGAHAIPNQGTISVTIEPRADNVAVLVSDDGVGMPEEVRLKVFDPFFSTKPVGQGTGLGLSISYTIVDAHGGTLTVDSTEGQGSTFTVLLPTQGAAAHGE